MNSALLSVYYVPGTVLSTEEPRMRKKTRDVKVIQWLIQKFKEPARVWNRHENRDEGVNAKPMLKQFL